MSIAKSTVGTSVSHGTLQAEDLLDAFWNELEFRINSQTRSPENQVELDKLNKTLQDCSEECWNEDGELQTDADGIIAVEYYVNETLPSALNHFAPDYCYFGAHQGDGSDFGYWIDQEAIDDLPEYESTDAAIEAWYESIRDQNELTDFKVVSDHGNVEIYTIDVVVTARSILGIV